MLERQLVEYINNSHENAKEFKLDTIPVISKSQEEEERRRKSL
jgi:coatomer protein complex subunit gamma